jgi:hypothetical protein
MSRRIPQPSQFTTKHAKRTKTPPNRNENLFVVFVCFVVDLTASRTHGDERQNPWPAFAGISGS